ncbi:unnamed protein product, partial [Symbiodinium microadriaticum]
MAHDTLTAPPYTSDSNLQCLTYNGRAEFDPLGFSDLIDIKWLRESELKHGRVCMLATIGFVAEQYWQLPGFDAAPDALQAIYVAPANATGVLLFLAGYIESSSYGG